MLAASPSDIARPFLWLAAIGFAVGFVGYLLLGGGAQALTRARLDAKPAAMTEPLSLAQDTPREV